MWEDHTVINDLLSDVVYFTGLEFVPFAYLFDLLGPGEGESTFQYVQKSRWALGNRTLGRTMENVNEGGILLYSA